MPVLNEERLPGLTGAYLALWTLIGLLKPQCDFRITVLATGIVIWPWGSQSGPGSAKLALEVHI